MAEVRLTKVEQGQPKVRNVPVAVTPEGFWCCPAPDMFQKTLKTQIPLNKPKPSSPPPKINLQKKQMPVIEREQSRNPSRSGKISDGQQTVNPEAAASNGCVVSERTARTKIESLPRKVAIEFGVPGTSDLKVVILGKHGFCVKLSVHKDVLVENSSYFAAKLCEESSMSSLQIDDCEDVEIFVETVGLMYCKEMKQRFIKQSVSRVLRVLKVAESLAFNSCIQACLEYLEAVPWVGEEEEEKVVSLILQLKGEGFRVTPILKRVSSGVSNPPSDTLSHIFELVLKSNEERGRREMKSVVLKLLKESNNLSGCADPSDICSETLYRYCKSSLDSLLSCFQWAAEPEYGDKALETREPAVKQIALEADNLSWLLEILVERQAADEFAYMWASQQELASLHGKLPVVTRHHVSCITARLFVGIGRGQLLPPKDTRQLFLHTWLQPLINDYKWLQYGCRSFDPKVVEEGIGRTILTLPLEEQQSILLAWLGNFLKAGDNCPNLQRAFEVWWRRTFFRPYGEAQLSMLKSDGSTTLETMKPE